MKVKKNRTIKFRGKSVDNGEWVYGWFNYNATKTHLEIHEVFDTPPTMLDPCGDIHSEYYEVDPSTIGQYTGLKDKHGKGIFEGDEVKVLNPVRTTQTHTGDNIPNGSYTEPMEPVIEEIEGIVVFEESMFQLKRFDNDQLVPLHWMDTQWDLESIESAIAYGDPSKFLFDDPEEGDLQYLIEEVAKVKDAQELIEYLSGIQIIGTIHDELKKD